MRVPEPRARRARVTLALLLIGCGGTASAMPGTGRGNSQGGAAPPTVSVGARVIGLGVTEDTLTPGDPADDQGRRMRAYEIDLDAGRRVRVRVPSYEGFDPMLRITGPDDLSMMNDDVLPHTLDAMLEFVPRVTGRYRVVVTTAPPGQTGRFALSIALRDATPTGTAITLGQRATAALGAGPSDPDFGSGNAWLHFDAQGGSIIRVRVTSAAFDTIATVLGPDGRTWTNDDANDLGPDGTERALDSTIVLAVPETGTYQLIVSSYAPGGSGAFQVATTVRPPVVVRDGDAAPSGPFAGPDGGGRVLGLYAGITEYQTAGRLYGCADDARLLGEAMRAARLQRVDEQTVLTDAQATRAAFLTGLQGIAARAQPADVVVVFWSGHGNVQPARAGDTRELDGLDETIVMIDGPLTDDEVVQAMSGIRAGTVILALDSCHAGGFADDFVTAPGRMGLFSSDEDVLSDTAEPHRAGGYLSWHLRNAVIGHADSKPRDGVLHAGELSDFLVDGFAEDHRLMNAEGDLDPSQRLVVRRGSVTWTTVLWVYPRAADLRLPPIATIDLASAAP